MMYAGDLIVFIEGVVDRDLLQSVWRAMQDVGDMSRLWVNLKKTLAVVKNCGEGDWD